MPRLRLCFSLLASAALMSCLRAPQLTRQAEAVEIPSSSVTLEGAVDGVLGINEAITIPQAFIHSLSPEEVREQLRLDAEATRAIGTTWVRSHTAVFPKLSWRRWKKNPKASLQAMDTWIRAVQAQSMDALVMISPFSGNYTASETKAYRIQDKESYASYVRQVVERYDGDGFQDMPGLLRPIHHWEIDNEPDLKNTNAPRGVSDEFDPKTFCTPEQYAKVLIETSELIRATDRQAVVLNGGFYRPMTKTGKTYMEDLFSIPGTLDAIDVLSIHAYHSDRDTTRLEMAIAHAREVAPDHRIWLTETSIPSEGKERWLDEEYQAEMMVWTFALALHSGVEKVFWHSLNDPPEKPKRGGPGMARNSLYSTVEEQGALQIKESGKAFKRLAQLLKDVRWEDVRALDSSGGVVVQLGEKWLAVGSDEICARFQPTHAKRFLAPEPVELEKSGGRTCFESDGESVILR